MRAVGWRNTLKLIWRYPPMVLTSIFSYWTIGPIIKTSRQCCEHWFQRVEAVGVSFYHTFVNILLTSIGSLLCLLIVSINIHGVELAKSRLTITTKGFPSDKCSSFGGWPCGIFLYNISIISPLFFVGSLCIVLLKCFSKLQCCGVPMKKATDFDINELNQQEYQNEEEPAQEMEEPAHEVEEPAQEMDIRMSTDVEMNTTKLTGFRYLLVMPPSILFGRPSRTFHQASFSLQQKEPNTS